MRIEAEQVLCRFQLSNLTRHGMGSLYEWIVDKARRVGLQGATVLEGFYGLKADGTVIEIRSWSLVQERPVVVEVVDEPARIEVLLAHVEPVFREGVITLERAHVLLYGAGPRASRSVVTVRTIIATTGASAVSGVHTMNVPDTGVLPADLHWRERQGSGARAPPVRSHRAPSAGSAPGRCDRSSRRDGVWATFARAHGQAS